MGKYDKSIALWNDIFSQEAPVFPQSRTSGNAAFDRGLQWLTEGAEAVLDFGCGNGILLLLCSLYGTATHIGIDLSPAAIHSASARAKNAPRGTFRFICGSLDALRGLDGFCRRRCPVEHHRQPVSRRCRRCFSGNTSGFAKKRKNSSEIESLSHRCADHVMEHPCDRRKPS